MQSLQEKYNSRIVEPDRKEKPMETASAKVTNSEGGLIPERKTSPGVRFRAWWSQSVLRIDSILWGD